MGKVVGDEGDVVKIRFACLDQNSAHVAVGGKAGEARLTLLLHPSHELVEPLIRNLIGRVMPVPDKDIEIVALESPEASFDGSLHLLFLTVVNLRLDEDLLASPLVYPSHHLLVSAPHVAICRVVEIDPEIKGPVKDRGVAAVHHA